MAAIMMQRVTVYNGITVFQQNPGVLELHDDTTVVLNAIDGPTGAITQTVFSVPANQLTVRGSMSTLKLSTNGVSKRIDFAPNSRIALAAGGVVGLALSNSVTKSSGINEWVAQLTTAGADVKFMRFGTIIWIGVGLGIGLLVFAVAAAIIGSL